MLSAAKQKLIQSLHQKKFRNEHELFVVEGIKIISEFILHTNLLTEVFISDNVAIDKLVLKVADEKNIPLIVGDDKILHRISSLTTPQNCIAIAKIIKNEINFSALQNQKSIVLDNIQDPGNLGTIIRTADWFGIKNIVCSSDTVDCYNPKVVQSSMGSLSNISIFYVDLNMFLKQAKDLGLNIYGTLLDGIELNSTTFTPAGILLLGNEANGINESNKHFITQPITIQKSETTFAESLNVAIAAAICCSRWQN